MSHSLVIIIPYQSCHSRFATFLVSCIFSPVYIYIFFFYKCAFVHYVLKRFIEHGINPILFSFLRSLIFLLLPFCLSPFASSSLGLFFDPRSLDPHLLPSHPALPCRFGSSRHRCNASCCAARVHPRNLFRNPGYSDEIDAASLRG